MTDRRLMPAPRGNQQDAALEVTSSHARRQSRAGYWFELDAPIWTLDKNNIVFLGKFRKSLRGEALQGFLATLAHYAETMSGSHTRNIADRCAAMMVETGATSINTSTRSF